MKPTAGLHTALRDGVMSTSGFGNEQDQALIDKILRDLAQEDISVDKALAVLDVARTAILQRTFSCGLKSFAAEDKVS